MPKMKSHAGSKKRFRISANGKVIRHQAKRDHLHSHKSAEVKRQLRATKTVNTSDVKSLRHQIPYL